MLDRLSRLIRRQQRVRSTLIGSMIYPALLISVSAGVLMVMMILVLPRFADMFKTLDAPLPASTAMLMGLSEWFKGNWWIVLGGLLISAGTTVAWARTPGGRRRLHRLALDLPILGRVQRSMVAGQIARLLGVLLGSKVPLLEAVELTRNAVVNEHYKDLLGRAGERVTKGEALSSAFSDGGLMPASMVEALRSAERGGSTAWVLSELADFIEEDNESLVRSMMTLLEPMILIVLGAMVAFVAISIFLPLFDLTAATQRGR